MAFQGRRKDRNSTRRRPWKAIVQTFEDTLLGFFSNNRTVPTLTLRLLIRSIRRIAKVTFRVEHVPPLEQEDRVDGTPDVTPSRPGLPRPVRIVRRRGTDRRLVRESSGPEVSRLLLPEESNRPQHITDDANR